jgi:hypothetical protein
VPTDNPIMTGDYLLLSGGQMTGYVQVLPPVLDDDAATKLYVDDAIASLGLYLGSWQPAANNPDITAGGTLNGENYIAETADPAVPEVVTDPVPGLQGLTIRNGDRIIWAAALGEWQVIRAGPLDVATADARYVQQAGDVMSGILNMGGNRINGINLLPITPGEATSKQYVDTLVAGGFQGVTTDASLTGDGQLATPLSVDIIDAGTF